MSKSLPKRPDLEQLKKQAKDLRKSGSCATLHEAQRAIAIEYGFPSWTKLKLHIETRAAEDAEKRLIEAALAGDASSIDSLICERPELARQTIFAAASLGDPAAIRALLRKNPPLAIAKGGPRDWLPLLYVCFGRTGSDEDRASGAQELLAHGADPNSHWFHPRWPESQETALYGATGVNNRPKLARLLLTAGADPNDGESRYHAAEHNHVESLEVLAEFGTDFSRPDPRWQNTVLYFLFGFLNPAKEVRLGIRWLLEHGANPNAISHGENALHSAVRNGWELSMIELLLDHGADARAKRPDGRTPYSLAVRGGRQDIVGLFRSRGLEQRIASVDAFLGACMCGDGPAARAVLSADANLRAALTPEDALLVHQAAKEGRTEALRVMANLGLEVAVAGADGETALHWAAWMGHADSVAVLAQAGVNVNARDRRFDAPPVGWVAHGSLYCQNPSGDYPACMEVLILAGATVSPRTIGSEEVMAVIKRMVPS